MVSDQKIPEGAYYPENMFLLFIGLVEIYFFWKFGYLPTVLVYGLKLDHGGFPVAAMIGDVTPASSPIVVLSLEF